MKSVFTFVMFGIYFFVMGCAFPSAGRNVLPLTASPTASESVVVAVMHSTVKQIEFDRPNTISFDPFD